MQLNMKVQQGQLRGFLTQPRWFKEEADGHFTDVNKTPTIRSVVGKVKEGKVILTIGTGDDLERMQMTLRGSNKASLDWAKGNVPDWTFER
jgi:hypothetical protein